MREKYVFETFAAYISVTQWDRGDQIPKHEFKDFLADIS